jgi:hypothetical protein
MIQYPSPTHAVGGGDNASASRNRILRDSSPHHIQEASIEEPAQAGFFSSVAAPPVADAAPALNINSTIILIAVILITQ